MSENLKPCPFCGHEAVATQYIVGGKDVVQCTFCSIRTHASDSRKEAIWAWNERPLEDAMLNKLMRRILKETVFFNALCDVKKDGDSYKLKHTKEDVSNLQALWGRFCRIMDMWEIRK